MSGSGLTELVPVVDAVFRAAQSEVSRIKEEQRALRAQLQDLNDQRAASLTNRPVEGDAAIVAGADVRWQRWIDQRKTEINLQLANLAAEQPKALAKLKKAFGRKEALAQLCKTEKLETRARVARRADQLS